MTEFREIGAVRSGSDRGAVYSCKWPLDIDRTLNPGLLALGFSPVAATANHKDRCATCGRPVMFYEQTVPCLLDGSVMYAASPAPAPAGMIHMGLGKVGVPVHAADLSAADDHIFTGRCVLRIGDQK